MFAHSVCSRHFATRLCFGFICASVISMGVAAQGNSFSAVAGQTFGYPVNIFNYADNAGFSSVTSISGSVEWGDGAQSPITQPMETLDHVYSTPGYYNIDASATFRGNYMTLGNVPGNYSSTDSVLVGNAQGPSGGPVYDVTQAFEAGWNSASNPNGVWTYGYSSGFTSSITHYDKTVQPGLDSPQEQLWLSSSVNIGDSPAVEYNDGPAFNDGNVTALANEVLLVSGIGGQYSDVVFTAPATGLYSVDSSFRGDQYGIGTLVGVVVNGGVVFSSSVTTVGQVVPFDTNIHLDAGETVEFSVGPGGGLQNTGFSATITALPEPCTIALIAFGAFALTRRKARFRSAGHAKGR